jgi:multimeric flavodoxin WrbA
MLCEELRAKCWAVDTKPLAEMRVRPCVGCFKCWVQTPGECVQNDDGRDVARAIAQSDTIAFLSPVTFGGYSSTLKHAADRMIPTISPLFQWVHGEMHHRLRYTPAKRFLSVGWQPDPDTDSANVFGDLARRNAANLHAPAWGSAVLHGGQSAAEQRGEIARLVAMVEATR